MSLVGDFPGTIEGVGLEWGRALAKWISGGLVLEWCTGVLVAEEVEHPTYRSWAQHPLGTSIVLEKVTEAGGVRQSSRERHALVGDA